MKKNNGTGKDRTDKGGFTLLEMVIAASILALTVGATVRAMNMFRRSADLANRHIQAIHIARGVVENLTRLDFYSFSAGAYVYSGDWEENGYQVQYEIDRVDSRTKDIAVTASWQASWMEEPSEVILTTSLSESLHP